MKIKKQLKKIKKLLRIIARNTEQKEIDVDKVAERLEEIIEKETPAPIAVLSNDELAKIIAGYRFA